MSIERWEYMTEFAWADLDSRGVKEFLKERWPDWQPNKYSPETMIPRLNYWGKHGWELIHMEPVAQVVRIATSILTENSACIVMFTSACSREEFPTDLYTALPYPHCPACP